MCQVFNFLNSIIQGVRGLVGSPHFITFFAIHFCRIPLFQSRIPLGSPTDPHLDPQNSYMQNQLQYYASRTTKRKKATKNNKANVNPSPFVVKVDSSWHDLQMTSVVHVFAQPARATQDTRQH